MVDLNKLKSYMDIKTRNYIKIGQDESLDHSTIAMESQIIKSRLKLPFWNVEYDEKPMYICSKHRHSILNDPNISLCSICSKQSTNLTSEENGLISPKSESDAMLVNPMWSITYRYVLLQNTNFKYGSLITRVENPTCLKQAPVLLH